MQSEYCPRCRTITTLTLTTTPKVVTDVQAVAFGCHRHVCRGETDGRDELFKLVLKALARFYTDVRIHLEGGKITFGMKARRLLRRVILPGR